MLATGGGTLAISSLLSTPGASQVVLEAVVPYARAAVDQLLGGPQETYCSSRAARRLAMVAWQRACKLGATPSAATGAAVTASLATLEPKRGQHRVVTAVQTLCATRVATLTLIKDARTRAAEEALSAALLLDTIAHARGIPADTTSCLLRPGEKVECQVREAPLEWQRLIAGTTPAVRLPLAGAPARLLLPGSFDPLHEGHRRMAHVAESLTGERLEFELSVTNVDKPPLDHMEVAIRAAQFADRPLWLTRAPTFLEKIVLFPEAIWVLGIDTCLRLGDPRYYGGSEAAAEQAVAQIAAGARGLIVFGRLRDGVYLDPAKLPLPQPLRAILRCIPEELFRDDVSSTQLRREGLACADSE